MQTATQNVSMTPTGTATFRRAIGGVNTEMTWALSSAIPFDIISDVQMKRLHGVLIVDEPTRRGFLFPNGARTWFKQKGNGTYWTSLEGCDASNLAIPVSEAARKIASGAAVVMTVCDRELSELVSPLFIQVHDGGRHASCEADGGANTQALALTYGPRVGSAHVHGNGENEPASASVAKSMAGICNGGL